MKNTAKTVNLSALVPIELSGKRLDIVATQLFLHYSRERLQRWIKEKALLVDNKPQYPNYRVNTGETLILDVLLDNEVHAVAQAGELNVVYEDESLLIINKPVGLVIHPGAGNADKTLLNNLLHYLPNQSLLPRGGIIHRLDKGTSGLLMIAKTLPAHTYLVKQLQNRSIKREYFALVQGVMISGGEVNLPIGRHSNHRQKMAVNEINGKEARTRFRVLERFLYHTLLRLQLETGRTHQIRVHMAHLHYPLVGDKTYGGRFKLGKNVNETLATALREFNHQALHAHQIGFIHPDTQLYQEWEVPLPEDFKKLLELLRSIKK